MKSTDLTAEQRRKLEERITRDVTYLTALLDRMAVQKFPEDDPLRVKTQTAHEGLVALLIEIQKQSHTAQEAERRAEHERISEQIAPAVAAAHKHRRWKQ